MHWNKIIWSLALVLFSLSACKKINSTSTTVPTAISYADYEADWQEIKKMENNGLGKSIIEKSNQILERAISENNINQVFKAMAYRSKYSNHIEEESSLKIITAYESQLEQADLPLKQLLHSATAELYFQYYNQNRWRFKNRTTTINYTPDDVRTWDLDRIIDKINQHYLASLNPISELSQFPTTSFKPILNNQNKSDNLTSSISLRPSLYDFLASRALSHFQRNEGSLVKAIKEFEPDNYAIFSPINDFIGLKFSKTDSNSSSLKAFEIFQYILKLRENDKDPSVLIDFNLDRLEFAYSQSNSDLKDSLFLTALQEFSNSFKESESHDEIDYRIAQLYFQWGSQYSFLNEQDNKRMYLKKAFKLCKEKQESKSFGARQCQALMAEIKLKSFSFQLEDTYLPEKPILFRFQYKNLDSVHFRIVQIPHETNRIKRYLNREELISDLLSRSSIQKWAVALPKTTDYQQHALELYTQSLPKGNYFILASQKRTFNLKTEQISYANLQVSNLSYFSRRSSAGNGIDIYALNRVNGTPISNVNVLAYTNQYDYSNPGYSLVKIGAFKPDRKGYVSIKTENVNQQIQFCITSPDDTLGFSGNYYLYKHNQNDRAVIKTHHFTDRAIYRPGQTVFFKGIVLEKKFNSSKPKADYQSKIGLYNVNGEELSTLKLTTNSFGSYQGSFVLPTGGLNGQYRIQDKHGSHYFSVEEYKRPSFKVELDTSTAQQKINQEIAVRGKVETYAGAKISDAKISYRIYRRASYPFWSYYRSFYPPKNEKEIANGVLNTDEKGAFAFQFFAQADASIQSKWNPVYNYEMVIDATSPSGETQSISKTIKLSEQSLFLSSDIDDIIEFKALKDLIISSKNINGLEVDSKAKLQVWKLKTPDKPKKNKLWPDVDQRVMTEKQMEKRFPSYFHQGNINNFSRDYEISNSAVVCNKKLNLFRELKPGAYELIVEADDGFGEKVEFKKRFILVDSKASAPPYPVFSFFEPLKTIGEPGDSASFVIGSSLANLKVLYEIIYKDETISQEWITLNNEQKRINIPIKESYRGGFGVQFTGIHSNRLIKYSSNVKVPYSNKKLDLKLSTFRSKVQPKSKEKWTLTVTGNKGEFAAAEVLVGMYDQSLDQFKQDDWGLKLYHSNNHRLAWEANSSFSLINSQVFHNNQIPFPAAPYRVYPRLNWFGFSLGYSRNAYSQPMLAKSMSGDEAMMDDEEMKSESLDNSSDNEGVSKEESPQKINSANPIRSDFRETVFFYPQLTLNDSGQVSFEFTMPDALTQWKFRALAHTKDLKIGITEQSIRTQKELMITANCPRFFREGDEMVFSALINNLNKSTLSGYARLQFFDALNENKIDLFSANSADQKFTIDSKGNTTVKWNIKIPKGIKAIKYRIEAHSESFSDGEEKTIPVLPNRILVTESLPLWVRGNETKTFNFKKLLASGQSESLENESFTIEFTSNPAWYAIQALPNLSDNGNENSEQVFSRLYANSLASEIANSQPQIKAVFDQWKISNSIELSSKLMQNQELKSILIEETPWLQLAKSESEQKKRIALLFDFNQMAMKKKAAIDKLSQLQLPNGAWPWYKGMRENRYITQYIVEGLGHMRKLGIKIEDDKKLHTILKKAIKYLDQRIEKDYQNLINNKSELSKNHLGNIHIHYLYARSFFQEIPLANNDKSYEYYIQQAQKFWLNRGIYEQGLIGLALHRIVPESPISSEILLSLADNSIIDDEMGMYWKNNTGGYYWYQAAIETQALLIEFFKEQGSNQEILDNLKIWLLKQKQTQAWSNSKSTASACYALLLDDKKLLSTQIKTTITVGEERINLSDQSAEAGTGYFKKAWPKNLVNPSMGSIKIEKMDDGIAWGAAYWQYYQELEKITNSGTEEIRLNKTLFKVSNSSKGEVMEPIDATSIKIGDKIKVRIQIESDRNLEFVHLKDMRAASFEPVNVLSQYKFQDGLGYYESTKDASTNFFIDYLNKGIYVFEYTLRASQLGEFSNGISTIQCQYAPEFSSHSKGRRVRIE